MDTQTQIQTLTDRVTQLEAFIAKLQDFSQIPLEVENAFRARGFLKFDKDVRFYGGASGNAFDYIFVRYGNVKSLLGVTNNLIEFTVNTGTDTCNAVGHGFSDGMQVILFSTDSLPSGLDLVSSYTVLNATADTFQLASDGINVDDITDSGTGTQYASFFT